MHQIHPLIEGFCAACKPADRRPPWAWCEEHLTVDESSPFPGRWRAAHSPWVRAVMEAFADNDVRNLVVQCAAQTAKSQTALACLCWVIAEDPGHAMWVTSTRQEMIEFARDRLEPTFDLCPPVRRAVLAHDAGRTAFVGMVLYHAWSGSKKRLQSKPIRWLFCDEVRNYAPGRLEMVLKRTRAYWNSRRFLLSTPGTKGDAMDRVYAEGNQQLWHFECPQCGQLQPLKFEQLKWDTNERTKPGGRWRLDALAETLRYECAGCGQGLQDTAVNRRHIASQGRYVAQNPNAPRECVSLTWSALIAPWVSWRSIVAEFLAAVEAMRSGDIEPMFTFVTETLGEPWDLDRWLTNDDEYLLARREAYDFGDPWPIEAARFLAADRQARGGEHYFWVCRAYGAGGASRLLAYGRCNTTAELEEIRVKLGVPRERALIDSGFKASEVYRFCQATGWKAMKGDHAEWFLLMDARLRKPVRQVWRMVMVDPSLGAAKGRHRRRLLPLFQWSNPSVKDHLAMFTHGVIGQWTLPRKVGGDYVRQMTAEVREVKEDALGQQRTVWVRKGRDNHYLDCELMIHVAAIGCGILRYTPLQGAAPDQPDSPAGA
ncbi:MAG: phage terminase large subunit family protein [Verrucomicrobia bacterium]|nr:phage terminase large subunit family protein [Verrucomicrobiota bacterium]